ncbi:N-acetyl-gamma-glutamyl-phosphate reductase [Mariniblastus sp.]|nr:N-acetyl-gamma-glutamyl-phosphate reductase [Mariniblastus sp.]
MIRVGIVGATGYTALELLKLLARHPQVEVTKITSRDTSCPALADVHAGLRGVFDLRFCELDVDSFCDAVDVAFCCLPHAASAVIVAQLLQRDVKVIDFSADYRLNDVASFEKWYVVTHPDPDRVGKVAYGVPEFFRKQIAAAQLVANPGCFPSSALLPLLPLLSLGLIETDPIIVDSKTGISGAGRKANLKFHYPECNESIAAYGVGTHRHMPEIDQIIARKTDVKTNVVFTPHLIPMDRGILSTIYVKPAPGQNADTINEFLTKRYADETFIRITDCPPKTKDVAHTNFCDIHAADSRSMVVIMSALDNLIKGASGAAVQNFNVMCGFKETTALI